jgi:hypothetical protein
MNKTPISEARLLDASQNSLFRKWLSEGGNTFKLLLAGLILTASISVAEGRGSPMTKSKRPEKAELVGLLGKIKAQMDSQFGEPIGGDNGEFVYDITNKGSDKPTTWRVTVQFNPLSKKVEVVEYSHRRLFAMRVASLFSDKDRDSIIKANIPNADLADVQNTIPKHLAFEARSNTNVRVKAFIVQDRKSHNSYYVETGYYLGKGIDFEQHFSFVYISDLSLAAAKTLNSSKR